MLNKGARQPLIYLSLECNMLLTKEISIKQKTPKKSTLQHFIIAVEDYDVLCLQGKQKQLIQFVTAQINQVSYGVGAVSLSK